jgi:hypothetical protein
VTEPAPLIFVGATAWVAPASSVTVSPTYPAGLAEFDVVYAVLHIKPDTATVATPANWSLVGAASGGSGSVGAGIGPTRVHVYKRTVPSGGLSGSQAFTITGGSSPVGHMQAWRGFGASIAWDAETVTSYSRTTASTAAGGTGAANLSLAVQDVLVAVAGTTDDTTTSINYTSLTAAGATLDPLVKAPSATIVNSQGNDIAAASAYAVVTAGSSSAAPVTIATANASETGVGLFFRVSATRLIPVTYSGAAAVAAAAAVTAAGVIVAVHSGAAAVAVSASVSATAAVEAPPQPADQSAEPGYGMPGAFYVGAVAAPPGMGSTPQVDAQAAVPVTAAVTAAGAVTMAGAAVAAVAVGVTADGDWWGAPRSLEVTPVSASQLDLDWDPVPGAVGYDVERDGSVIVEDLPGTAYSDVSGLSASTLYAYRVAATR